MKKTFIILASVLIVISMFFTGCGIFENRKPIVDSVPSAAATDNQKQAEKKPALNRLYYSNLDNDKKEIYEKIYKGIMSLDENFYVSKSYDADTIFTLVNYVCNDHPEIFWIKKVIFSSNGRLQFEYNLSEQEIIAATNSVKQKASEIIKGINTSADDYTTALEIFDYIAQHTTYDESQLKKGSENYDKTHSIEGVLLNGKAVCEGYARAYQYLLALANIESALVSGEAKGDNHAWLVIRLDGKDYYSDVTWGDQTDGKTCSPHINHYYFAMTEEQLLTEHSIDKEYRLFTCNSTDDNYYVREGLWFEEYNYLKLIKACKSVHKKYNREYIELYAADKKAYDKMKSSLIDSSYAEMLGKSVLGKSCSSYVDNNVGYLIFF